MKRLITSTYIVVALLLSTSLAVAQTSDYQIKKKYEDSYKELKTAINNAMTVNQIDSLSMEISNLKYRNEEHEELLDNALYPETFESSIANLQQNARNAEHKLLVIEDQNERLDRLSSELSNYKSEIAHLNNRTDSLRNAILNSEKSESNLSALVKRYRNSMQKRDEFVLSMIDSLFITYKDMNGETMAELSDKSQPRSIQNGDNPLKVIESVIDENLQILKSNDETLQTKDYLRMYVVQNRFNEVWNRIGNDLATIYGENNAQQWEQRIDKKLTDWKASASKNMWASMDTYIEKNGLKIGAFDNNKSFYAAIEAFINDATDASREKVVTKENYKDFQAFYDFWNGKIKNDWGQFVQEGEVLTMSQISTIDTEMMNWRDEAKPRSFVIPILFGLSLLTIVGLIIVLARR
jgi:hypothetical protein